MQIRHFQNVGFTKNIFQDWKKILKLLILVKHLGIINNSILLFYIFKYYFMTNFLKNQIPL